LEFGEALSQSGEEGTQSHPWCQGMNWEMLLQDEAQVVHQPENPEDTEYFDSSPLLRDPIAVTIEIKIGGASSEAGRLQPATLPRNPIYPLTWSRRGG
jgi:serine/threonine-protein kinase RIM15